MARFVGMAWWLALAMALSGASPATGGDASALPPRDQLVRVEAWAANAPPEDFGWKVSVVYLAADPSRRQSAYFARQFARLSSLEGGEDVIAAFVVAPVAEARGNVLDALRSGETAAALGLDAAPDGGQGATEQAFREAGFEGDAVALFSRAGQVRYASSVTAQNRASVGNALRRAVAAELRSMEIRARVVGPDGAPVPGCRVSAVGRDGTAADGDPEGTGADGTCYLPSLRHAPAAVVAFKPGTDLSGFALAEGEGLVEVRVELAPRTAMAGRVVGADGRGVRGALVQISIRPRIEGSYFPRPALVDEIRTGAGGRFAVGWLPATAQITFDVSAEGRWTETVRVWNTEARPLETLPPVVLHPADRTLDLALVDLEGKPLPRVRCTLDGQVRADTDERGRLLVENVPSKPLPVMLRRGNEVRARTEIAPGQALLAVATRPQVEEAKKRFGTQQGAPPWMVEQWAGGSPLEPAQAREAWLVAALLPRGMSAQDQVAMLRAMSEWQAEHRLRGMRAVAVLPAGTPEGDARALAAEAPGVSVAVDATLQTDAAQGPLAVQGRTEALWRGWDFRADVFCYVQEPGGDATPVRFQDDLSRMLSQAEQRIAQIEEALPLDVERALAILREKGVARWILPDPYDEGAVWAGTETDLVQLSPRENVVRRFPATLGIVPLRPVGAAFTPEMVFIGTPGGLVAYQRSLQSWNRLVPGGEYDLIDAAVERLEQTGERIEADLAPAPGRAQRWVYERGKWGRVE